MEVSFLAPPKWIDFYAEYEKVDIGSANSQGWVNVNCHLPTHPKEDTHRHGGLNIYTGRYKCFNLDCIGAYKFALQIYDSRESISAEQYLRIRHGLTPEEARETVASFRLEPLETNKSPDAIHFNSFSKIFRPSITWKSFTIECQEHLTPDLEIVKEYMESRGLRYETLVEAGVGYVPENGTQIECLIHPYYVGNQVVGIRGRTIDGRKGGVKDSYSTFYGLQLLPEEPPDTIIIAEGETDTLVLRQFLRDNNLDTPVIGIPGSTYDPSWNRHIQGIRRVIFVAQTDSPSQKLAHLIVSAIPKRAEIVQLPFGPHDVGKDISDYILLGDTHRKKLIDLLGIQEQGEPKPYAYGLVELFKAADQEVDWNVQGILERDTKIFLAGEPKTHKTWLALELAQAAYTGEAWLNNPLWCVPQSGMKTLFVEEEGSLRRLGQRVKAIFSDVDPYEHDKAIQIIHQQRVRLDEVPSMDKVREKILDYWPDILILDPLVNLHSLDENAASDMTIVMDTVNMLMRLRPGMSVIIIHHLNHSGYLRGSSALFGSVDAQITLRMDDSKNISLSARGREIEEMDGVSIVFNKATKRHSILVEVDNSIDQAEVDDFLLKYLHAHPGPVLRTVLRQEIPKLDSRIMVVHINRAIRQLISDEKLKYTNNGLSIYLAE